MAEETVLQAYLEVCGADNPKVVLRPKPQAGEGRPANLVELPGAVFNEVGPQFKEGQAWAVCGKVAELCRTGHEVLCNVNLRNAAFDHLDDVHHILVDYMTLTQHEEALSSASSDAMLRAADASLLRALKLLGFVCEDEEKE